MNHDPLGRLLWEISGGELEQAARTTEELERAGDRRGWLLGRLLLASRRHEGDEVQRIAASPHAADLLRGEPRLHAVLARSLYWSSGLQAAAAEFRALCTREGLSPFDSIRRQACALTDLAALVGDRPLHEISLAGDNSVALLRGHKLLPFLVSVNDLPPEYFLLDTGAPTSVLSRRYCDRAGIPYLTEHTQTARDGAGREVTLFPTLVDRLKIGGVTVSHWTAQVIQLSSRLRIAGILSPLDTLRGLAVEIDLRQGRLLIYPGLSAEEWGADAKETVFSTPLVWDEGNVFVRASVNGQAEGWFLFDTGAGGNLVTPDLARALGRALPEESPMRSIAAGGASRVYRGFTGELAVGKAPPVRSPFGIKERWIDPEAIAPLATAGYVGLPWMEGRRILLSPDGRRLLFTDQAAPTATRLSRRGKGS